MIFLNYVTGQLIVNEFILVNLKDGFDTKKKIGIHYVFNTLDSDRNLLIMKMLEFRDGSEFHLLLYVGTC